MTWPIIPGLPIHPPPFIRPRPPYLPIYPPSYPPPYPPQSSYTGCIQKWANINLRDGRTFDVFVNSIDEKSLGGFLPSGQQNR